MYVRTLHAHIVFTRKIHLVENDGIIFGVA